MTDKKTNDTLRERPVQPEVRLAKMTISRTVTNFKDDYIRIEIDSESFRLFGEMSLETYAKLISGMARQPVDVIYEVKP